MERVGESPRSPADRAEDPAISNDACLLAGYQRTLGRFTRGIAWAAWLWSALCVVTVIGLLGDPNSDFFGVGAVLEGLGTLGFLLAAPAVSLAPCIAQELERGTWPSILLSPRSPQDLWVLFLRARVKPWLLGFLPAPTAILVAGLAADGLPDGETLLGIAMVCWWVLHAGAWAVATSAFCATLFRSTAACVGMALLLSFGGELVMLFGTALTDLHRLPDGLLFLLGFLAPLVISALPAWLLVQSALTRLSVAGGYD